MNTAHFVGMRESLGGNRDRAGIIVESELCECECWVHHVRWDDPRLDDDIYHTNELTFI